MTSNDLDPHLIKCIGLMYESRKLKKGDPVPLQYVLEEAIYQKYGVVKDYTDFFQSQLPSREPEETSAPASIFGDKGNGSDNDLELDLFNDDLMCVICNKMDVGARNRLLECSDCHALYHQECHRPAVADEEMLDTWTCSNCKSIISSKKLKTSEKEHVSKSSSSSKSGSSSSSSHKHGSSSSHKSSSDKYKSSSKSSSGSKSSNASPSHSSSRSDDKKSSSSKSSSSSNKSSSSKYSEKRKHD
ncbi:integrator complex subunit 12-like [Sitophilus oryzae]|uniref:Integrator complex subunit 12 n=1 Tax=Sitophilus oryzae TaxID=7048 RepID=A0A6J2Y1G6_SITOR|nr:integrator complex subunit 12-like [Sitophilus oryzae]XP_030756764.1 integrator complex subunit 12-like [Sitophilus oryzae]